MPVPRDFAGDIESIVEYHSFDKGERDSYRSPHNKITIYRSVNSADPNDAQVVETRSNFAKLVEQSVRDGGLNAHGFRDLMDTRKSLGETDDNPALREADEHFRQMCDLIDIQALGNALCSEDAPTRRTRQSDTDSSAQGFANTLYQTVTDTLSGTSRIINDNVKWLLFGPDDPNLEGGPPGPDQFQ